MRIGFLFNHDATHQVAHTMPVAAALAARGIDVEILTSSAEQRAVARDLLPDDRPVRFTALRIGRAARIADTVLRHVAPFRRLAILRQNLPAFRALDALVVPETTSTLLRTRFGLSSLKLIYVPHGAGDGAAGFQNATRHFDLVLLSGSKVRDRMLGLGLVTDTSSAIVGYPKFDLAVRASATPLFDNGKPTVLYNPHFNPLLSSWYTMGPRILRWFADQDQYNLVFAPHVMLFKRLLHTSIIHRSMALRPGVPKTVLGRPGILVDTGSARSIDMSYVHAADIYLGDVSSQIYEWIRRPRPAIFLDTHRPSRRRLPDYRHWTLGEVLHRVEDIPAALARAARDPGRFTSRQQDAAAATFSVTEEPAGQRAAEAILAFLARTGTTTAGRAS